MANTYILIASNTVSSATASVTFSGIPNTYTDLLLRCSNRTASGGIESLRIQINSDTGTNYSYTQFISNGSTLSATRFGNQAGINLYDTDYSSDTANVFSIGDIYFPNYLSAYNKPIGVTGAREINAVAGTLTVQAGLWRNSSAISSMTLTYTGGNNHLAGSTFYLYGIKNS